MPVDQPVGSVTAINDPFAREAAEVAEALGVDPMRGLGQVEVERRAASAGRNELERIERPALWRMVLEAATEPFVVLLLIAGRRCDRAGRGARRRS